MAKEKKTKKELAKTAAETVANAMTFGGYATTKAVAKHAKGKYDKFTCEKAGDVWSNGKCIPKSQVRKGKSEAVDWYPEQD